jgi:hypothetical protein
MDGFDYLEERPSHKVMTFIWNVLTILMLLGVVCVVGYFLMVFTNPNTILNPFRPQPLPPPVTFPTATVTPRSILPATWTPLPTLAPSETSTQVPTDTPAPSATPGGAATNAAGAPTDAAAPSATAFSLATPTEATSSGGARGMPFDVSPGTPLSTSSAAFHPEAGCDWLGVAGQVHDLTGAPISGQQVRIGGFLGGKSIDNPTLTGLTSAYGTDGFYEFYLGEELIASNGSLWVQLIDQAGLAMSEKIFFDTYDSCDKNLTLINFRQVR